MAMNVTNGSIPACATTPCAPCYIAAKTSWIEFPYSVVEEPYTVSVVPHITQFPDGKLSTSYSTVTDNHTITLGGSGNATGEIEYFDKFTWEVSGLTLTYPTTYFGVTNFSGKATASWKPNDTETCNPTKDTSAIVLPATADGASLILPLDTVSHKGPGAVPTPVLQYLDTLPEIQQQFSHVPLTSCSLAAPISQPSLCTSTTVTTTVECATETPEALKASKFHFKNETSTAPGNETETDSATDLPSESCVTTVKTIEVTRTQTTTQTSATITGETAKKKTAGALTTVTGNAVFSPAQAGVETPSPKPVPATNENPPQPETGGQGEAGGGGGGGEGTSESSAGTGGGSTSGQGESAGGGGEGTSGSSAGSGGGSTDEQAGGQAGQGGGEGSSGSGQAGADTGNGGGGGDQADSGNNNAGSGNLVDAIQQAASQAAAGEGTAAAGGGEEAAATGQPNAAGGQPANNNEGQPGAAGAPASNAGSATTAAQAPAFNIAGQTLTPGGAATFGGAAVSELPGQNGVVVGGSQTVQLAEGQATTIPQPGGGRPIEVSRSGSAFIVDGQTLGSPGQEITAGGTEVSLGQGTGVVYVNGVPTTLGGPSLTLGGQTYTADAVGGAAGSGGVGGYIYSGMGGGASGGGAGGGGEAGETGVEPFAGVGARVKEVVWMVLGGAVVAVGLA
ncbi:hypothetical protein WHR41_03349 [Cladosporium halotolerans]|uniref:Uncharacterized protein n=1 Tax=Cladosporium halotolerans TaxID=1052096 RepID=A0AB34KX89_9PEZI